mmetsp:Transcript_102674/g.314043  ORF Transcript_102674/g.314043 Transcript_102674/m.314043 type:complete len:205 (-) Transcript_102674:1167-1781(-)
MTNVGPSAALASFLAAAPAFSSAGFVSAGCARLQASTSSRFVASSRRTGSRKMFSPLRDLYATSPEPWHWKRSSTTNSKSWAKDTLPGANRLAPTAALSAFPNKSKKCCKNSAASCCRLLENSGWPAPTSRLNIAGDNGSIAQPDSFESSACRGESMPFPNFAICATMSRGTSCGALSRRVPSSSAYLDRNSGNVAMSCTVALM